MYFAPMALSISAQVGRRLRLIALILGGTGLVAPGLALSAQGGTVQGPDDWVKGETHEHLQWCPEAYPDNPDDRSHYDLDQTTTDVFNAMLTTGLQVANVMIWNNGVGVNATLDNYGPLVTGVEDLATSLDPDYFIKVGLESSGFPVASLGHVSFLNITDPYFDPELDIPFQLIDWFKQQPGVVVGAPHQLFPATLCSELDGGAGSGFINPPNYSFIDTSVCDLVNEGMAFPTFTFANLFPVFLPLDVATKRVDYLEAIDLTYDVGAIGFSDSNVWYGLYYKLLSLGLRPSIGGGNDVNCASTSSTLPARTYVWMGEEALNFESWSSRLADGYVSLAMGDQELLLMDVNGLPPGSEILLGIPAIVSLHFEYMVADGVDLNDVVEILVDGEVVSSTVAIQPGGGSFEANIDLPIQRSCWVAARTQSSSTHTAAIFVEVSGQPIVNLEAANYMLMYTSYLDWNLDLAVAAGVADDIVGDSLAEVRQYVASARSSFLSRRDYAKGLPVGVKRYGRSARAQSADFMPIVIDAAPVGGAVSRISLFNAPPGATAILLLSAASTPPPGIPLEGAKLLVDLSALEVSLSLPVDEFGHTAFSLTVPPSSGATKYMQIIVVNPPGSAARLSSTDAFTITY